MISLEGKDVSSQCHYSIRVFRDTISRKSAMRLKNVMNLSQEVLVRTVEAESLNGSTKLGCDIIVDTTNFRSVKHKIDPCKAQVVVNESYTI